MAAVNLDLFCTGKHYYLVTLAPGPVWFTEEEFDKIIIFCKRETQVLAYTEVASHKHLHVLLSSSMKKTFNVTRSFTNFFTKEKIPFVDKVTIDVRHSTVPIGYFWYLTDEIKNGTQVAIKGWRMTWIQDTCRANLKVKPRKMLNKDTRVVNNVDGPALISQYAELHHMMLIDKVTFVRVVARMMKDKYLFHNVKPKCLFATVLAIEGHPKAAISFWENELFAIDS